jgi:hypothetical protein
MLRRLLLVGVFGLVGIPAWLAVRFTQRWRLWWLAPMTGYRVRGGLNLPVRGQAVWNLPSGDLVYAGLAITNVEYKQPLWRWWPGGSGVALKEGNALCLHRSSPEVAWVS